MSKELFITSSPHETKVAVLEDDQLVEVYYERDTDVGLVGGIYKGRVSRVLPGMQSAFVDIGLERDAFLYVSDFFFEDQDDYDKVLEEAEARATRFTAEQAQATGAQPAPPPEAPQKERPPEMAAVAPPVRPEPGGAPAPQAAGVPPSSEPVSGEAGAAAPPAAGGAAPPLRPAGEPPEHRRFDSRGQRRKRRKRDFPERRFGEHRVGEHKFVPRPESSAPGTFEILPGESLAKYSHAAPQTPPPEAPAPTEPAGEVAETVALSPSPEHPPLETVTAEVAPAEVFAQAVEAAPPTVSEPEPSASAPPRLEAPQIASTEPAIAEGAIPVVAPAVPGLAEPQPVCEPAEPLRTAEVPKASEPGATPEPAPPAMEAASPSTLGEFPPIESLLPSPGAAAAPLSPVEAEAVSPAATAQAAAEPSEVAGPEQAAVLEASPTPAVPEEAVPSAPASVQTGTAETSGEPRERAYTLREPHQRPRFAPRRGQRGRRDTGPGPRPPRHEPSRSGNNQPLQIAELLKEGQEILVQIAKEPLGTKGARITSHIALPGRYLVYMPTIDHIGVSRKIASEEERLRLRNIILENKGSLSGGFIVRTAGEGRSEEEFKADLKFLSTLWNEIRAKSEKVKVPALIHRDLDLIQRLLRDLLTPDFKCVRVDNEVDYERVLDFAHRNQPSVVGKIKLYTRDTPLFEEFGIQAEIEKALRPKVWLKSGGYIVINQTEALVAIDVNTGKYVGKTNRLEDTILKTNVDAVNEIVRQVRLRDLGGIIVIDFIDMDERKNRAKVVQALEEALHRDRAPTKVISFHDFGLVAITRKRVKQSLERTLCEPCNYCTGSGWIKSVNTVCYEILSEARKMAKQIEGNTLTLRVNPEVAKALKSSDGALVSELESLTHKDVIIKSDPTVHQERFEIF
jgi:ribonuclease G